MSRLIDADTLMDMLKVSKYYPFGLSIEDVPTVVAISIEWIAKWMGKHQGLEYDGWNLAVGTMVKDWEKENEQ